MTTDWMLIRRAAAELERALRGGRVVDAGLLDDGRIAVRLGGLSGPRRSRSHHGPAAGDGSDAAASGAGPRRGGGNGQVTLAVDAFGSPPLVALTQDEMAVTADPGWLRSVATTLRGMRLTAVRARRGDRVLVLTFGTASRFGVETESRMVLELVPRYGNVVLLHDRMVVAAAKQFSPAENEARAVQIGLPYEPPPLQRATLDFAAFTRALEAALPVPPDTQGASEALDLPALTNARIRALGGYMPELPRLVATSLVAQSEHIAWQSAQQLATWLDDRGRALLSATEGEPQGLGDVHVYREPSGDVVAAHVVPLAQYERLAHATEPSLLDVFAEARAASLRARRGDATERRRSALLARIMKRTRAVAGELAGVRARLADVADRDRLRASGDALYTHLHEIPAGAATFAPPTNPELTVVLDPELDAKENAQRYYARYRKASDALPHLERRIETLTARREALDVLAFETERADTATLAELEPDLDELEGRPNQRAAQTGAARKRQPLRVDRTSGARIYVGRSPRENVEVTFRIARPHDLWFHARGIPGSHVVLQAPPGTPAHADDLAAAADLAAAHSKAKNAPRVEIDYTERKHVRKQRDAGPGLVWYTNARTMVGRPPSARG